MSKTTIGGMSLEELKRRITRQPSSGYFVKRYHKEVDCNIPDVDGKRSVKTELEEPYLTVRVNGLITFGATDKTVIHSILIDGDDQITGPFPATMLAINITKEQYLALVEQKINPAPYTIQTNTISRHESVEFVISGPLDCIMISGAAMVKEGTDDEQSNPTKG